MKDLVTTGDTMGILAIANRAEETKDAFKKIIAVSLAVTTVNDWVDMNGKPYLQVSGLEKIGHLFGISWTFDSPDCENEHDGHYTYTYTGIFTLGDRSITVEGSRSSKDLFFKQNDYTKEPEKSDGKKIYPGKPILERDNKRDVRMSAMTNLIGNGITRILGLRGITYDILEKYTNITKEGIANVQFNKSTSKKKDYKGSSEKAATNGNDDGNPELLTEKQKTAIENMSAELEGLFVWETGTHLKEISKILDLQIPITAIKDLTKKQAIVIYKVLYDLIAKNKQTKDK